MQPLDLAEFVRRRPFRPFRITLTDGRTYEVHHPELAMVGLSTVVIGVPAPNYPDPTFYQRAVTIDLGHIMEAEALPAAATPTSN
jgi:hypothetical protein